MKKILIAIFALFLGLYEEHKAIEILQRAITITDKPNTLLENESFLPTER